MKIRKPMKKGENIHISMNQGKGMCNGLILMSSALCPVGASERDKHIMIRARCKQNNVEYRPVFSQVSCS